MSSYKMFFFIVLIFNVATLIVTEECTEEIKNNIILIPRHEDCKPYYGCRYIERHSEEIILDNKITCFDVELPIDYRFIQKNENTTIILEINSLKTKILPALSFQKWTRIDKLILNNLGIEKIMPSAFSSNSLKQIILSNNHLTEIGLGIFNHLIELDFLDLSHNNIKIIQEHSFLGITQLTSLILSSNQLTNFSFNVLDPKVGNLELLDLSNNNIDDISLTDDINIKEFRINNNKLKNIDFCPQIFEIIYLNNNFISKLPLNKCLDQNDRLQTVDLSFNNISDLTNLTFYSVTQLNINNNFIRFIPTDFFYNMIFLMHLNISHNFIESFQYGIFDHISNLTILDVSYNRLSDVSYFYSLSFLNKLYINNNNINYINPTKLFSDLPKLTFISVGGNKFTCGNLIEIVRYLKTSEIEIQYGDTKSSSNIHGISCEENNIFENKPNFEQFLSTILKDMNHQSKNNVNVLKHYFEDDFKNSSFYKFMQTFQKSQHVIFNDTEMYKYFNNQFNQSNFFKYLEGLKDKEYEINFAKNVSDFINNLKNNKIDRYLINYTGKNEILDKQMFDYFNKDFEKSEFFKYFENLRVVNDKNIPENENVATGYRRLFVSNIFNLLFMIVICSLLALLVYKNVFVEKYVKPETVELVSD